MGGVAENVLGGRLAEVSGDLEEAASRYALAAARLDDLLATVRDGLGRAAIRSAWRNLSVRRASVALRRQDVEGAFDALQRGRGDGEAAAPWSHVRRHLGPGEMVLMLSNLNGAVWAFAAPPARVRAVQLPAEASALASLAAMWRKTLDSANASLTERIGARIATATLGAIDDAGLLRGVDTVVVIADGELQNVAFGALEDAAGGGLIGDRLSFTRSRSLASLERAWHQPPSAGAAVVFVAVRSHTARAEIRSVLTFRPGRSYLGASATESAFLRVAATAGLLHFGGHSFAPVGPGEEGGLLLKGDKGHDVLVTYQQIAGLPLSGATVVLLGCDTARRGSWPQRAVGGLPSSLADAFFAAGSRTVIGSLWEIDDQTAFEFAAAFYGAGGPAAGPVSLRQARREMRARYPRHPRRWAGVIWEGVPRPIPSAVVSGRR